MTTSPVQTPPPDAGRDAARWQRLKDNALYLFNEMM